MSGRAGTTFEILRRWCDWMEVSGRHAETTRRQYRRYAVAFFAETLIELADLEEEDVVEFLKGLPGGSGMRAQTIKAMKSLTRFAHRRGLIEHDVMEWMTVPRASLGDADYLNEEQLERVFAAAERLDPRARPTLELIFATGARVGSVCAATPEDVDWAKRRIHWRVTKGDRPYSSKIGPRGERAVRELLELIDYVPPHGPRERRPTLVGAAPVVVQRWAHLAGEMVGLRVYPHLLRHSFCERIANKPEIPEIVVVEAMGWKDGSQLRRYAKAREALHERAVAQL